MNRGTARSALCFLAGVLGIMLASACGRANRASAPKENPGMSCVVRIDSDDGSVIRREISAKDQAEIFSQLRNVITSATSGKIQYILRMSASDASSTMAGTWRMVGRLERGQLQGTFYSYVKLGGKEALLSEVTYRNDLRDGVATVYYPYAGRIAMQCKLRENLRDGELNAWYSNGQSALKCRYDHGQLDGTCVAYDPKGVPIAEGTYRHGERVSGTFVDNPDKVAKMAHLGLPYETTVTDASGVRLRTPVIEPPRQALPKGLQALENM